MHKLQASWEKILKIFNNVALIQSACMMASSLVACQVINLKALWLRKWRPLCTMLRKHLRYVLMGNVLVTRDDSNMCCEVINRAPSRVCCILLSSLNPKLFFETALPVRTMMRTCALLNFCKSENYRQKMTRPKCVWMNAALTNKTTMFFEIIQTVNASLSKLLQAMEMRRNESCALKSRTKFDKTQLLLGTEPTANLTHAQRTLTHEMLVHRTRSVTHESQLLSSEFFRCIETIFSHQ